MLLDLPRNLSPSMFLTKIVLKNIITSHPSGEVLIYNMYE
jgi:hypothetical protein